MSKIMYWNGNGTYQALNDKLRTLIPHEGPVPTGSPKLEKLRVAGNCYYDLFNNGLGNRAAEFRRVFGFGGKYITENGFYEPKLEAMMDDIILAAGLEQGLCKIVPIE